MDKAIVIENLSKTYKNNRGIQDICLEVERGDIFGFLGPNGAGKTTTIKMMVGLINPDSGSISINGYDIVRQPLDAKKCIGYVPDNR